MTKVPAWTLPIPKPDGMPFGVRATTDLLCLSVLGETSSVLHIVYLSLGSNLGKRDANLHGAIQQLAQAGNVTSVSSFYETEPVDVTDQAYFLNCVLALETSKTAQELLAYVLWIEHTMGRQRTRKKGPRLIDIDILLFGNSVIDEPGITIPHPALQRRRFVLEPLVEIAPDAVHPVLKKTAREMLSVLPPGQIVRPWVESKKSLRVGDRKP